MEEIMDFDKWISEYTPTPPKYVAVYDPETGSVKSVGPSFAFEGERYKLDIESDIAESILSGETSIHRCIVDVSSNKLSIAEIKSIIKIDDVLHRIILLTDSDIEDPDVCLTYDSKNKTLKIEISEDFGGTKKMKRTKKSSRIVWDGDTEMSFLITEYNDPNMIFEQISVKISELMGSSKIIENFDYTDFSIYTRRLFNNYVIDKK